MSEKSLRGLVSHHACCTLMCRFMLNQHIVGRLPLSSLTWHSKPSFSNHFHEASCIRFHFKYKYGVIFQHSDLIALCSTILFFSFYVAPAWLNKLSSILFLGISSPIWQKPFLASLIREELIFSQKEGMS